MSKGVIISTHGLTSIELLKSAEMIVGNQTDVETVTFKEGEGIDDLKEKYNKAIQNLQNNNELIILADLWGGSPFNVAVNLKFEVVTGVNIPMLIELFMNRDHMEMDELIKTIMNTSKESIMKHSELKIDSDIEEEF